MIRSKCFFSSTIFKYFGLTHKENRCGQMGPTPCYSQHQVVFSCLSFRPVAPFFFLVKVPFSAVLNIERGVAI